MERWVWWKISDTRQNLFNKTKGEFTWLSAFDWPVSSFCIQEVVPSPSFLIAETFCVWTITAATPAAPWGCKKKCWTPWTTCWWCSMGCQRITTVSWIHPDDLSSSLWDIDRATLLLVNNQVTWGEDGLTRYLDCCQSFRGPLRGLDHPVDLES